MSSQPLAPEQDSAQAQALGAARLRPHVEEDLLAPRASPGRQQGEDRELFGETEFEGGDLGGHRLGGQGLFHAPGG